MSLTITTQIETNDGFAIENAYGRVAVVDNIYGTDLNGKLELFVSLEAFEAGKQPFYSEAVPSGFTFPYERTAETVDILDIAHDYLIAELAVKRIVATKNL
jgi:hypothetical protein